MEKLCSICKKETDSETSAILAIGGYGNPKYICNDCAESLDTVIKGREYDEIVSNISSLSEKMMCAAIDDEQVLETVENIFATAKNRAELIRSGEYDFACDEDADDGEDSDIPEELRETEEDKLLDAQEREEEERIRKAAAKFDMFFFYPLLGAMFIGALVYLIISRYA